MYMDVGMGRMGMRFIEEEREWRLPGLSFLCSEWEEDLRVIMLRLVEN